MSDISHDDSGEVVGVLLVVGVRGRPRPPDFGQLPFDLGLAFLAPRRCGVRPNATGAASRPSSRVVGRGRRVSARQRRRRRGVRRLEDVVRNLNVPDAPE